MLTFPFRFCLLTAWCISWSAEIFTWFMLPYGNTSSTLLLIFLELTITVNYKRDIVTLSHGSYESHEWQRTVLCVWFFFLIQWKLHQSGHLGEKGEKITRRRQHRLDRALILFDENNSWLFQLLFTHAFLHRLPNRHFFIIIFMYFLLRHKNH